MDGSAKGQGWKKILCGVMLALSLGCVAGGAWFQSHHKVVAMNFRLPETDIGVVKIPGGSVPQGYIPAAPEGGGSGAVIYSDQVEVDVASGTASLMFRNPEGSGTSMIVHVLVDGRELGATGLIPAGYGVDSVAGLDTEGLAPGYYRGSLLVDHYDPETGEKSVFSLDIETAVTAS